uniref:EGF-like domain-containing protein 2 n=1 Tax=Crassostrea virginica TaxID=6565 RepID=A0A8B8ACU8_CRAVI|nr:EGF-like domain-containing protein 2 [Crassostrea virginica]
MRGILFLTLVVCFHCVFARWHCRNKLTGGCQNGGTCDSDSGECTCPTGFEGYNCGLQTALVCPENTANCRNGGRCFDTNKCFCPADYIGEECETAIASMTCRGEGTDITVMVPDGFRGEIYSTQSGNNEDDMVPAECKFTPDAVRADNYIPYKFTIPFDRTSPCINASLNETVNENGDSVFTSVVVKTYSTMFITDYDEELTFVCVHSSNNFTLGTRLDQVDLDKSKDLQKDKKDDAYSPVRMNVLNKDDTNLTGTVNVGDVIKLRFYLDDETVYKSLRMEDCTANDTKVEGGNSFKFLEKGCPTDAGAAIMVDPSGQTLTRITHPFTGGEVAAAVLPVFAFKFKSTGNVAFNCQVKICRDGEENNCAPRCGESETIPDDGVAPAVADGVATVAPDGGETPPSDPPADGGETPPSDPPADGGELPPTDSPADGGETPPSDPPAAARRKRRSAGGEVETFSAIVSVVDPFDNQWRRDKVVLTQTTTKPTTESPEEEKTCFRSQEILIVIIVMSVFVFILLIACLVMSCAILKLRKRFTSHQQENESQIPRFFLPHAKLQA